MEKGHKSGRAATWSEKPIGNSDDYAIGSPGRRDEVDMLYMGKRQQLKRHFGWFSMLGVTCTLTCTWEAVPILFVEGLENGGPGGLIYGFLYCWLGTMAIAASLGEMASMAPTSGGQYHWVALLAPPKSSRFLSYFTDTSPERYDFNSSIDTFQAVLTSGGQLVGTIIQGLVVLNHPTYDYHRWQGTLLFWAVILVALFTNIFLASLLPKIEVVTLAIHLAGFLAILVPLVYLSTDHSSAAEVFTVFTDEGGWNSTGLSFFVGLTGTMCALVGADAAIHMAEEVQNASTVIPWTMIGAIAINGTLGLAITIAILFCMGNIADALASPTGFPFIEIFYSATSSAGGATAMTSIITFLSVIATVNSLLSASRQMWAFARDNALPFSHILCRIETRTQLPLYSLGLSVTISYILALINIGSSVALNAIVSLVVAGLYTSYVVPITLILIKRVRGDPVRWGPWKMGRWGILVNIISIIYIILAVFFSFFPPTAVVTPATMNWSILVYGVVVLFSVGFWFVHGHKVYNGPIMEVTVEDVIGASSGQT